MTSPKGQERGCQACGTRLARDNRSRLCSPCSRHEVVATSAPIKQDAFWQRAALRDALESRHFGQVLNVYRYEHRPILTQAKVGRWLGLTQGQVSRLERTAQPTHDLNKLGQWARACVYLSATSGSSYRNNQPTHTYSRVMPLASMTSSRQEARTCNGANCSELPRRVQHLSAARRSAGSARRLHRGQARERCV